MNTGEAQPSISCQLAVHREYSCAAFDIVKLPYDKLLHFAAGSTIATLVVIVTGSLVLAGAAVLLAGVGREVYDACHPDTNTADIWDVVATCAGWIPVALVVLISQR